MEQQYFLGVDIGTTAIKAALFDGCGQKLLHRTQEYELLKLLLHNAGIVVTREIILERVWGIDFEGESRTLDMHIRTLRQKLGEAGSMIRTVRNVGYMIE